MNINVQQYQKGIALVAVAILIFWFGRLSLQYQINKNVPPVQPVAEINQKIPMVEITGIQNGKVFGTVNKPEMRVKSGNSVAVPDAENQFQLDIQHLGFVGDRRPVVVHHIPEWALFVASKNGKYFYEFDEGSAKNLSVENRVYFATEADALKAGYAKRQR